MPRINQVPSCCGAAVIHNLDTEFAEYKQRSLDYVKKKITSNVHHYYNEYIIILNDLQVTRIGHDLVALGFVKVSEVKNKNTRRVLHTFIYSRPDNVNTDGRVADVSKAYPKEKVVEKKVMVYSLNPDQKERLKRAVDRTKETLTRLELEMNESK